MHSLDGADAARVDRSLEVDHLAVQRDLAFVGDRGSRQAPDQRGLAGARRHHHERVLATRHVLYDLALPLAEGRVPEPFSQDVVDVHGFAGGERTAGGWAWLTALRAR